LAVHDPALSHGSVMSLEPMRPITAFGEVIAPLATWPSAARNATILDFGQNLAGWVRWQWEAGATCAAGTKITVRHAELIFAGNRSLDPSTLRGAAATDTYICSGVEGGVFAHEPRFTYHGFRFAEVAGVPAGAKWSAVARVVHSDVSFSGGASDADGHFEALRGSTGGPRLLNAIMRACEWTQRDNLHSIPTDCPQRDERQGCAAGRLVVALRPISLSSPSHLPLISLSSPSHLPLISLTRTGMCGGERLGCLVRTSGVRA
jgi:alpha-L-rhamnosidase